MVSSFQLTRSARLGLAHHKKWKNTILLMASCLFYSWSAPKFLFILLASSYMDYVLAHQIYIQHQSAKKKWLLLIGLILNAGLLLYFKYANFFIDQANAILTVTENDTINWVKVALPIGISFFTFQKISYLVDVYRKNAEPAPSYVSYALYVSLFPQLIAGPIIRYHDVARQLVSRKHTPEKMFSGICRFCIGLGKKILIANSLGKVADSIFALPPADLSTTTSWLGALCYTFQIYYDFSGYSDMAIGLGRMFGFEYLENFRQPYLAKNFTEFWQRWHISLSNWMREYIYIPLGGNRKGLIRMFVHLWIVFLLSGFWHGASWTFIAWGAFHGFFLSLDKLYSRWKTIALPAPVATLSTFMLLMVSWVIFRSENLNNAWLFLQQMFSLTTLVTDPSKMTMHTFITSRQLIILMAAIYFSFMPIPSSWSVLTSGQWQIQPKNNILVLGITSLMIFLVSIATLSISSFNPFIYFRF